MEPPFTLVTDHKPLVHVFNNPKAKPLARLERWNLRLLNNDSSKDAKPIDLQDLKAFHKIRHELTVATDNDTIFRGLALLTRSTQGQYLKLL